VTGPLADRDEITIRVLAVVEDTTVPEQRRAIRVYARQARQHPDVARIVRLIQAERRRTARPGNVIALRTFR
jgi:methionine salvage enolase-phosphatase E1